MIANHPMGKELLEKPIVLDGVEETLGKYTENIISGGHKGDLLDQRRKYNSGFGALLSSH
jgi:hypothetical protein